MHRIRFLSVFVSLVLVLSAGPGIVRAQEPTPPVDPTLEELAARLIRCTDIDGEQYCLVVGFISLQPGSPEWQEWLSRALAQGDSFTGDMSLGTYLRIRAGLSPRELRRLEAQELATARAAVGGIKLGNYLGERQPIPEGFFARYPALGIAEGSAQAAELHRAALTGEPLDLSVFRDVSTLGLEEATPAGEGATPGAPDARVILTGYFREQQRSYWCGPATMESFGDACGPDHTQAFWANVLGTETYKLTFIQNMVATINSLTCWNNPSAGGPYAVVSVAGRDRNWFVAQHEVRIGIYGAPIVEHVWFKKVYFNYLRFDDYNGHYQTGRGYSHNTQTISIFEPYDERDWRTGGNATAGPRVVSFQNMWDATRVHPQQNFGR